VAAMTP